MRCIDVKCRYPKSIPFGERLQCAQDKKAIRPE